MQTGDSVPIPQRYWWLKRIIHASVGLVGNTVPEIYLRGALRFVAMQ